MRRQFFCLFFIFSAFLSNAQKSIIKTNPLSLLGGFVAGCFEHTIDTKTSYQVTAFVGYDLEGMEGTSVESSIGYRKYITKKLAPRGFYIMPYIGGNITGTSFAGKTGIDLGYQWMWQNGITLDAAMGPDYYLSTNNNKSELFDGAGLNLVFTFGYIIN